MTESILFTQATILPMDEDMTQMSQGFVAVAEGKITYVGTERPQGDFGREISCEGKILMPGLVNAHTHLPMTLLRGLGGGNNLQDWLNQHIFPAEARLDSRAVRCGTELAVAELLQAGVTCVADMYNFCDDIAEVLLATGMNANLSRGVICFDPEAVPENLEGVQETVTLIDQYHGANGGQILVNGSLHGEYTSFLAPQLWEHMAKMVQDKEIAMHIHISETHSEHEECKARHGKTPLQIMDDFGLWERGGIAAHCVWTEEEDWALMAKKGISPIHNPVSNLKLGSGIAPIHRMLQAGVKVALGTDSVASNNNHDLWEEIKLTAMLHNGLALDPTLINSKTALTLATSNGAVALGRKTGQIKEGYDGDIILVDMNHISMTPCHDPVENLVFSARGTDVCLTMCGGKILYENGTFTTIDVDKVKKEVKEYGVPCILGEATS